MGQQTREEPKRTAESAALPASESEKYESSAPGPEQRKDGVYFLGYKRENAYESEPQKEG